MSQPVLSFFYPIRNRKALFMKTVGSLLSQNFDKSLIELIVVDQGDDDLKSFLLGVPIRVVYLRVDTSRYSKFRIPHSHRPCPVYVNNLAYRHSLGQQLVLTSPEVYHVGETVQLFLANIGKYCYLSVYDMQVGDTEAMARARKPYCSPERHDLGLYFCGSVPRAAYETLNGMDERYMEGQAVDDCDFGTRLALLGYEHNFVAGYPEPHTYHQPHESVATCGMWASSHNHWYYHAKFNQPELVGKSQEERFSILSRNVSSWGDDECLLSREVFHG